ncbi:hypothetical protein MPSEU_000910800 [Mayamaea pseudoterrestris]|nr:hypothetical protein MPSEU_000910800 [Mayamaea pseudoterrestris]
MATTVPSPATRRRPCHWSVSLSLLLLKFSLTKAEDDCSFYLAESSVRPGRLGLYSARAIRQGSTIANASESVLILPVADANKNEWSPWHGFMQTYGNKQLDALLRSESGLLLENQYRTDLLTTGLASMMVCSFHFSNVQAPWSESLNDEDPGMKHDIVTRDRVNVTMRDASAGSFIYHSLAPKTNGFTATTNLLANAPKTNGFTATTNLWAGEELVLPCDSDVDDSSLVSALKRKVLSTLHLQESAICLSNALKIQPSSILKAGSGSFATRHFQAGQVIESSPVLHFDQSQIERVEQQYYGMETADSVAAFSTRTAHSVRYQNTRGVGYQLLLNYCFASNASNVLLLPLQPAVSMLNHASTPQYTSNARLEWSTTMQAPHLHSIRPMELFAKPLALDEMLVVNVIATRDILPNEEVLLDYGDDWAKAFDKHAEQYEEKLRQLQLNDQVDPLAFAAEHALDGTLIRTLDEQASNPYPQNLQTACYFGHSSSDEVEEITDSNGNVVWTSENYGCLRPCDVLERTQKSNGDGSAYKVMVRELDNMGTPSTCKLSDDNQRVDSVGVVHVPATAIRVMHKAYYDDAYSPNAFRHAVGVPNGLYPEAWAAQDPNPTGDFIVPSYLPPGHMEHIRWKDTGSVVTPNAYILGISERVRLGLLDYCNKTGIYDILKHVTSDGNGLLPDDDMFLTVNKERWYLQRPGKNWHSDLHWLSPAGHPAHEDYLQALGASGFDEMLRGVGEQLQMDGLVAFHVTFIAVSQAIKGYLHHDVTRTQAKTYNIIIPLLLANDTGPELDLQQWPPAPDGTTPVGRLKYQYGMAAMMGDDAYHATSSVDYRPNKEMRLAATVYVADVNALNVERIQDQYTQAFPPRDSALLMSWAGRHWRPNDASYKLPVPVSDHVLAEEQVSTTKRLLRRVHVVPDDEPKVDADTDEAGDEDDEDEEEL